MAHSHPQHQVHPLEGGLGRFVLVCDVWGTNLSWKSVGIVLSQNFRRGANQGFTMMPTGIPSNRALLLTANKEFNRILAACHTKVGKDILVFQKWSSDLIKILPEALKPLVD